MNRLYGLNSSKSGLVFCLLSGESLNVASVVPYHYHGTWRQRIIYGRVLTDGLTKEEIKRIFEEANAKEIPDIIEKQDRFEVQYANKPSLIILKKDGKIYCEKSILEKFDRKLIEHQASILLTILNKGKRVDHLHRKNEGRKPTIKFVEVKRENAY